MKLFFPETGRHGAWWCGARDFYSVCGGTAQQTITRKKFEPLISGSSNGKMVDIGVRRPVPIDAGRVARYCAGTNRRGALAGPRPWGLREVSKAGIWKEPFRGWPLVD